MLHERLPHVSPGLVERVDLDVHVRVLAEDLGCVVVRVERVHQNQRHVRVVLLVQILHVMTQNLYKSADTCCRGKS